MTHKVSDLIEAYRQAVYDRDIDAFVAMYDDGARIFDTWGVWSYEEPETWRQMVAAWLSSLGSDRVRVTTDDVRVIDGEALCVVTAVFRYAAVASDGAERRAMQNRLTWVLKRYGETWKIVHEHTSVPIAPDDGKAILQRETA